MRCGVLACVNRNIANSSNNNNTTPTTASTASSKTTGKFYNALSIKKQEELTFSKPKRGGER